MMPKPLVSIIIPCFNYGHYLGQAIESALRQTYRPIEVIVVDDGSTDDTARVATRYPINLISQTNQGLSASTNVGVRASRGEFFARLDADDVLCPTFVEKLAAALGANPSAAVAHSEAEYFGRRTGRVPFVPFDLESLAQGALATCCALMRRSAWDVVGGLDPGIPLCEDWDLWLAFAECGYTGVMLHEVLWGYRHHGRSMVHRTFRSWADMRREYRLIAHLQDHHPDTFAVHRLLSRLRAAQRRVVCGQMQSRVALKLLGFYGVMLARALLGLRRARPRIAGQTPACSVERLREAVPEQPSRGIPSPEEQARGWERAQEEGQCSGT